MLKAAPPALFCRVHAHCPRKRQRPSSGDALPARKSADAPPASPNASSCDAPRACRVSGTFLVLALSEGHAKRRVQGLSRETARQRGEGHWMHSRAVWHPRRVRGGMRFCGGRARSGPRFAATDAPTEAADYASL